MAAQHAPAGDYSTRYKFNGKELDQATGLYYYGARYYDPKISTWLSVDPLAEQYQAYSPYNYTLNNPINFIDPDGRSVGDPPKPSLNDNRELFSIVFRARVELIEGDFLKYAVKQKITSKMQIYNTLYADTDEGKKMTGFEMYRTTTISFINSDGTKTEPITTIEHYIGTTPSTLTHLSDNGDSYEGGAGLHAQAVEKVYSYTVKHGESMQSVGTKKISKFMKNTANLSGLASVASNKYPPFFFAFSALSLFSTYAPVQGDPFEYIVPIQLEILNKFK
jgi:RHS repeat-associated protein